MLRIKLDSGTNQISHVSLMRNITGSPNDALSSKGEHRFKNHTRCCRSHFNVALRTWLMKVKLQCK